MVKYNYYASMRDALLTVVPDYCLRHGIIPRQWDIGDLENELYDNLMDLDEVTGNKSGYYIHHDERIAYGRLYGNLDLASDALYYFGCDENIILSYLKKPSTLDVIIRCYILRECLHDYLTNLYNES